MVDLKSSERQCPLYTTANHGNRLDEEEVDGTDDSTGAEVTGDK